MTNYAKNKRRTWESQFSEAGGQMRCPEDDLRPRDEGGITYARRTRAHQSGPRVAITPPQAIPTLEVERRVLRGMSTLRAVPDREKSFMTPGSAWPNYVQDYLDAYDSVEAAMPRFKPSPADISDYLTALSWVRHLQHHEWRLLWWRSYGLSFGLIGKYIGKSDETARRKYKEIMIDVWCAANNVQAGSPTRSYAA